jgi:hypothetical protein
MITTPKKSTIPYPYNNTSIQPYLLLDNSYTSFYRFNNMILLLEQITG